MCRTHAPFCASNWCPSQSPPGRRTFQSGPCRSWPMRSSSLAAPVAQQRAITLCASTFPMLHRCLLSNPAAINRLLMHAKCLLASALMSHLCNFFCTVDSRLQNLPFGDDRMFVPCCKYAHVNPALLTLPLCTHSLFAWLVCHPRALSLDTQM